MNEIVYVVKMKYSDSDNESLYRGSDLEMAKSIADANQSKVFSSNGEVVFDSDRCGMWGKDFGK